MSLVNNGQKLFPELVEGQLLAINAPLRLREVYPELIEGLRSGDKKHIIHQAQEYIQEAPFGNLNILVIARPLGLYGAIE